MRSPPMFTVSVMTLNLTLKCGLVIFTNHCSCILTHSSSLSALTSVSVVSHHARVTVSTSDETQLSREYSTHSCS